MTKRKLLLKIATILVVSTLFCSPVISQENEFNPSGNPFATIFANFHRGIYGSSNDDAAFELSRGYIGYEYNFSPKFYSKINLDIGSPNDLSPYSALRRYAYFKNAFLRYSEKNFVVDFGLINLRQFGLQEQIWERRYLMKCFADEYRLGSSADLGMSVEYKFNEMLTADFTVMNGEGYNNIQTDGIFKYGLGSTIVFLRNLTTRAYFDFSHDNITESSLTVFCSFDHNKKWNLAGEVIFKNNFDWKKDHNLYGVSFFGKYNITSKYQLFARYDWLGSNILDGEETPWHLVDDGTALVGGLQYTPIKNIKVALNYHDWCPWAANLKGDGFVYLNLEVKM
jgi:hypothetical protein